jgi:long-chain acyl-CoA synthetase
MHPTLVAQSTPDKPALVWASTGETISFRELEARSNQGAQLFRALGLNVADNVAIFLENHPRYFELCWAAQRAGLYYTCIPSKLTAGEAEYILRDCGAKVLIAGASLAAQAGELARRLPELRRYMVGGTIEGTESWEDATAKMPASRIADETAGYDMLYSSGTTGRPKGVRIALTGMPIEAPHPGVVMLQKLFKFGPETIYLSTAPFYHAAPLRFMLSVQRLGGTVVAMEHFDPEATLETIARHGANAGTFVPTMFVRLLKLPPETRAKYDVTSMKTAIHGAAPCPVEVKRKMIEWWGPVLYEYYAATEGNGFCFSDSADWLAHPGTVGRAIMGKVHICDDRGNELPPGEEGLVYFGGETKFEYHNDREKTAQSRHPVHAEWSTMGDVGRLDEEGFLYLTDRRAFMIISGGVNVYPQETENLLIAHPKVADVAVIGVPSEDLGEEVKAVVQPVDWADATPAFAKELIAFARAHLAPQKCPKSIDFEPELPRHATGKLYKRLIRDRYWGKRDSKIV